MRRLWRRAGHARGRHPGGLAVRLREYHEKTNPVLDIFRRKEYVITVDTRAGKEQVQQTIREKLKLPSSA